MNNKIYIDLDGVLADFFHNWNVLTGESWQDMKDINSNLNKIRNSENFWINLPFLQNGKNLIYFLKLRKLSYSILSAPLLGDPRCINQKKQWVKKHLFFYPPKEIIISSQKQSYAKNSNGLSNILIDDFGENIRKWNTAGGIGIKHKEWKYNRTKIQLKKYLI